MNHCSATLLSSYLDGELTLPKRRELEKHLVACSPCQRALEDLRHVDRVLVNWSNVRKPLPLETELRLLKTVDHRRRFRPLFALTRFTPAAVGTSVAALLVLASANLGLMYGTGTGNAAISQSSSQIQQVIAQQSAPLSDARRTSAILGVPVTTGSPSTVGRRFSFQVD